MEIKQKCFMQTKLAIKLGDLDERKEDAIEAVGVLDTQQKPKQKHFYSHKKHC